MLSSDLQNHLSINMTDLQDRFTTLLQSLSPPQSPSRRTPQYSTHCNTVDNIERYLQEDGHRIWGFAIYRCTYESDSDWQEFVRRLRYRIEQTLKFYNGMDMMDSLSFTVIEDLSILDGASTSTVREHFKQWAATAPQQEQGTGPALSQRYRYCLMVDNTALISVIHDASAPTEPESTSKGVINLIWKDWKPSSSDLREEVEEPIEGCRQQDVGWMIVAYQDAMVGMYYYLRDLNDWYHEYRRPPQVARA